MFGWMSPAGFTEEESCLIHLFNTKPVYFPFFPIVETATFFAVLFAGSGVRNGLGFGLLSVVTVGAFLMRYWSFAAANFTAGSGLHGLCQVS